MTRIHFLFSLQDEERETLRVALEESRDKARRRSLGNIKFIGELFKLKMLTEAIMHDCVVKLLKNHDEESLECLCRLLSTIGKDLDFEKAKVSRLDAHVREWVIWNGLLWWLYLCATCLGHWFLWWIEELRGHAFLFFTEVIRTPSALTRFNVFFGVFYANDQHKVVQN